MADFDPIALGDSPSSTARPVFNAGSTAGSARNIAPVAPGAASPKAPDDSFDPETLGDKPSEPQADFDPSKVGDSMADPKEIEARAASDSTFQPNEAELRALYDYKQGRTLGQKATDALKSGGNAIASVVKNAVGVPGEQAGAIVDAATGVPTYVKGYQPTTSEKIAAHATPLLNYAGRQAATYEEAVSDAASGVAKFGYKLASAPVKGLIHTVQDSFDPLGEDARAYARWKDDYLTQLAQSRGGSNIEAAQSGANWKASAQYLLGNSAGAGKSVDNNDQALEPFPKTAATASLALQIAASKLPLGDVAPVVGSGTSLAKAAIANSTAPVSTAEKVLAAGGNAAQTVGGTLNRIGSLPRRIIQSIASNIAGPEFGGKVAATVQGAALTNPAGRAAAALEAGGASVSATGQFVKTLAETPASGPFGRLVNLAKSPNAPQWIKGIASIPAVRALYGLASTAGIALKGAGIGAVKGAALGAGLGTVSGDSPEELGSDIATFAGFGAAHGMDANAAQLFYRRKLGILDLVANNLKDGVAPETLAKVPFAAMLAAADIPYLGILDAQGRQLKVRFANAADMGQTGVDGAYDKITHTITLNADNLQNNPGGSWTSIFHELLHPLAKSAIANQPGLSALVDAAVSREGLTLDQAKKGYIANLLNPALDAEGITDPAAREQRISDRTAKEDSDSLAESGNADNWIRSELISEAGRQALGTKAMLSPEGSIASALKPSVANYLKGVVENMGVKFKGPTPLAKTVIPGFDNVAVDPSLRKAVFNLLKSQRDYIPGKTAAAEQGTPLTPADMGGPKAPFHTLPNGNQGNKYSEAVPDGKGGTKVVMRNPGQIRKAERAEAQAMKKYIQPGARVDKLPAAFYADPNIGEWTKQAAKAAENSSASGTPLEAWYHGLNKSGEANWKGSVKKTLGNVMASHQRFYVMPNGMHISKAGNPLMDIFSMAGFDRKAQLWMNRKGPLSLERWNGDIGKFTDDVNTYNKNHASGLPGDANNIGPEKRDTINAFLFGRNAKFEKSNPLRSLLHNAEDKQGVVRSLRLDRLETLEPGQSGVSRPDYQKGVQNFSPSTERNNDIKEGDRVNFIGGKGMWDSSNAFLHTPENKGIPLTINEIRYVNNKPLWYGVETDGGTHTRVSPNQIEKQFSPAAQTTEEKPKLRPALMVGSQPVVGGRSHAEILQGILKNEIDKAPAALDAFLDDSKHVFVDQNGKTYSRTEGAQALGLPGKLDSSQLPATPEDVAGNVVDKAKSERQFSPSAAKKDEPEHIVAAANKYSDGYVSVGTTHADAQSTDLENTVGDEKIPVVHLSSTPNLKTVDPKFFGKGRATPNDQRGGAKSYFFVKGSPLEADANVFGKGGYYAHTGEIDGSKIYDLSAGKPDPMGYYSKNPNREEADDNLREAGYDGVKVGTEDGRQVVMMYKPVKVKPAGAFKGETAQFSPEAKPLTNDDQVTSWMNPAGERFSIGAGTHYDWAKSYFKKKGETLAERENPEHKLKEQGWLRLADNGSFVMSDSVKDKQPNSKQKAALVDLAINKNRIAATHYNREKGVTTLYSKEPDEIQYSPAAKPNDDVRKVADSYMKSAGLENEPHTGYTPLNEALGRKVADFYQTAKHDPENPAVKASYEALANETVAQWRAAEKAGMDFEPWTKEGQPYKNSAEMAADVRDNKHLYYFPTEKGFGEEDLSYKSFNKQHGEYVKDMLFNQGEDVSDKTLQPLYNDTLSHLQKTLSGQKIYRAVFSKNPDEIRPGIFWTKDKSVAENWNSKSGEPYGEKEREQGPKKILIKALSRDLNEVDLPATVAAQITGGEDEVRLKKNHHLYKAPHPMLEPTGIKVDGKDIPVNDAFRAVHDYFGHAKEGYEFGPRGEYNAFLSHSKMFSDEAKPAMAAETMGQNSWVNFGQHLRDAEGKIAAKGEPGYVSPQDRPYAEQKATTLPDDLLKQSTQFSPGAEKNDEAAPEPFYSHLARVVDDKFFGKSMPAAQLSAMLRNPQNAVKADELKWSGLDDYLKGKSKVTKEEIQDYLKDNTVKLIETVRGKSMTTDEIAQAIFGLDYNELFPEQRRDVEANKDLPVPNPTKFDAHTLPGGDKNYREFLFQLPNITAEGVKFFQSSHWKEPNVIAHARINDRTDSEGKNGLFAEELQSDWHQKGRREGYAKTETTKADAEAQGYSVYKTKSNLGTEAYFADGPDFPRGVTPSTGYDTEAEAWEGLLARLGTYDRNLGVPDAPFKTTWHETVMRRLIHKAAEEGKDWFGWTTGDQQNERYDLSKQIHTLEWDRRRLKLRGFNENGENIISQNVESEKDLEALIGKDPAQRIIDASNKDENKIGVLEGEDLKIGGEGMRGFYDKILVDYANKFGKKWGAKVEDRSISQNYDASSASLFTDRGRAKRILDQGGEVYVTFPRTAGESLFTSWDELEAHELENRVKANGFYAGDKQPEAIIHSLPITPEMRESLVKTGVPLFSPKAELSDAETARYAKRIASTTKAQGGTTFNVAEKRSIGKNKNFGLSIYPDRSVILDPQDVTSGRIQQFIKENADLLQNPDNNVGTWLDKSTGKVYLDVSVGLKDLGLAKYAAAQYNQKAIWDSAKGEEIPTGGTGEPVKNMPPAADRLRLLRQSYAPTQKKQP